MDNFLTELGIKHEEVTNSYTPEVNKVAERFNLTAVDGIKTLLKSSEVPHKFWGEALLCFTYAWNRICHKDSKKTPFEKYSGRKPSVLYLKPFGFLAYSGVPKQIRKKFDMRVKMGNIMGYAQRTKGYRIWLTDENKLVETINEFSDLTEQQEALMVEVIIPNCYKQAIRSREASKWHDAMYKEINVMMERKVWDLVDPPDNIKILENRWVHTIKYDENSKIVRYKARLVAQDNLVALHFQYNQARRRYVEWAQNEIAVVPDFHKRILFSDEAHFWLNGYVNKQNCRIWSEANPQVYVETPLHPEKLTVWCALWAGGILLQKRTIFHNVTVKGDRYRAMITNFFISELNNHDVQELWFQQDGATCHTARATIDLLKDTFGDRLISRVGPVNWPSKIL
ncbi:retrovirus-related Pol polyprotein from transposon TNT 1-94 [Trichonephila clavipes]|nr:retrovirus-related Pol polyprotein from transposon TNT 1-94 [Trichonephila clavipes]